MHYWWYFKNLRKYFVGNSNVKKALINLGISKKKICVYGIPISRYFCQYIKRNEICEKLGLIPNKPIIIIMGGGTGLLPMKEILNQLCKISYKINIIIVAGTNDKLVNELSYFNTDNSKCVKIFSYINFINELMFAADVMITKAGGVTIAEALSCGLPMVIFKPIPGHEWHNAEFLLQNNSAIILKDLKDLNNLIYKLLFSKKKIKFLKMNILKLAKPKAAFKIAEEILLKEMLV